VAGLLLAVAVASIPVAWRRHRYGKQVITATVVAVILCSGWTIAKGDLGPPGNHRGSKKYPDSYFDPGNPSGPGKGRSPSAELPLLFNTSPTRQRGCFYTFDLDA
jgi:hypothetical protein